MATANQTGRATTGLSYMFLDYYSLHRHPFGVTPDPRSLHLSPTHREALASLLYGIQTERGFMAMIAPVGMGKTTLLHYLLEQLREKARTAFIFQTQSTPRQLLRRVLDDLGVGRERDDMVQMHQQLNVFLFREAAVRRPVIVVIDEAQNLSYEVLESVRLLSNFETNGLKLIQIILAGQPALADKLARPELEQLRQRFATVARLQPFDRNETEQYINHRLSLAGANGKQLFSGEALALIAAISKGVPRMINNLCFNALSLGFAMRKKRIDAAIVREVAADLDIISLGSGRHGAHEPHPDGMISKTEPDSILQKRPDGACPHSNLEFPPVTASGPKSDQSEITRFKPVQSTHEKLEVLRKALPNGSTDMLIRVQQALDDLDRLGSKNPLPAS